MILCAFRNKFIGSITLFQFYMYNNKKHDDILPVNDGKDDDGHEKVTEDIWKDILQYLLWEGVVLYP